MSQYDTAQAKRRPADGNSFPACQNEARRMLKKAEGMGLPAKHVVGIL